MTTHETVHSSRLDTALAPVYVNVYRADDGKYFTNQDEVLKTREDAERNANANSDCYEFTLSHEGRIDLRDYNGVDEDDGRSDTAEHGTYFGLARRV